MYWQHFQAFRKSGSCTYLSYYAPLWIRSSAGVNLCSCTAFSELQQRAPGEVMMLHFQVSLHVVAVPTLLPQAQNRTLLRAMALVEHCSHSGSFLLSNAQKIPTNDGHSQPGCRTRQKIRNCGAPKYLFQCHHLNGTQFAEALCYLFQG